MPSGSTVSVYCTGWDCRHEMVQTEMFHTGLCWAKFRSTCNHCTLSQTLLEPATYLDIIPNDVFCRAAWYEDSCTVINDWARVSTEQVD